MKTLVNDPGRTYPVFEPNQVLTDTQLNLLRDYLQAQNRHSRSALIGSGVACGLVSYHEFDPKKDEHFLHISPGYGLTSSGLLIALNHSNESAPDNPAGVITYDSYRTYHLSEQDKNGLYEEWSNHDLLELLPVDTDASDKEYLKEEVIAGRVLVLFSEERVVYDKPTVVEECNPSINNVRHQTRLLLVPRDLLRPMPVCPDLRESLLSVPRFTEGILEKKQLRRKRRRENEEEFDESHPLVNLKDRNTINEAYGTIVEEIKPLLVHALQTNYEHYRHVLDLEMIHWEQTMAKLDKWIDIKSYERDYDQYFYGFIIDLVQAHREFMEAACGVGDGCGMPVGFPKHLMLCGYESIQGSTTLEEKPGYRHVFQPAAMQSEADGAWQKARQMFLRIQALIEYFDYEVSNIDTSDQPDFDLRITPSHSEAHALGLRAIPFYYNLRKEGAWESLTTLWQPRACCTVQPLLSYYHPEKSENGQEREGDTRLEFPPLTLEPLYYRTVPYTHFRIEGQLGKACETVIPQIDRLREKYNLPFDFLTTYVVDDRTEENELLEQMLGKMDKTASDLVAELDAMLDKVGADIPDVLLGAIREELSWPVNKEIVELDLQWKEARNRRPIHACTDSLRSDYLIARTRGIRLFEQLLKELFELDKTIFDSDILSDEAIADAILEWSGRPNRDIIDRDDLVKVAEKLRILHEMLKRAVQDITLRLFPKELSRFNYYLFIAFYKQIMSLMMRFVTLMTAFVFGDEQPPADRAILVRLMELHRLMQRNLPLMYNSLPMEIATLFASYEAVRSNDYSLFENLVNSPMGLEHTGGVQPGGTFILVCDEVCARDLPVTALVVADFSLPGKLDKCLDLDFEAVDLPPVALPDLRRVPISAHAESSDRVTYATDAYIDVIGKDDYMGYSDYPLDYGFQQDLEEKVSTLRIRLPKDKSAAGRTIRVVEDPGQWPRPMIKYEAKLDPDFNFVSDHFDYLLEDDSGSQDKARVHVICLKDELPAASEEHVLFEGRVRRIDSSEDFLGDVSVTITAVHDDRDKLKAQLKTIAEGNEIGKFVVYLPQGSYNFQFEKEGYYPKEVRDIGIMKGLPTVKEFELVPIDPEHRRAAQEEPRGEKKEKKKPKGRQEEGGESDIEGAKNEALSTAFLSKEEFVRAHFAERADLRRQGVARLMANYSRLAQAFHRRAIPFLNAETADLDKLTIDYLDILWDLTSAWAEVSADEKSVLVQLITWTTHHYWDQSVWLSPQGLQEASADAIRHSKKILIEAGVDPYPVLDQWDTLERADELRAPSIREIEVLILDQKKWIKNLLRTS